MRKDLRRGLLYLALLCAVFGWPAAYGYGDTVSLIPTKDNTLYADTLGRLSNGIGWHFFVGPNSGGGIRRGLLFFDIAGNVPAGSVISNATLILNMSRTPSADQTVKIHRALADWGEGTSDAGGGEGGGTFATPGDATWKHTFYDNAFWGSLGGDFSPVVSASQVVVDSGQYSWSGAGLVADVQSMLDNPAGNYGWMMRGPEGVPSSVKRFDTKDNGDPATWPVLEVEYTTATAVRDTPPTAAVELHASVPNPFNPSTSIRYTVRTPGAVSLMIHDARGSIVRVLVRSAKAAGSYSVLWDGRDDGGAAVSSGVYFIGLESAGQLKSQKIVLLK
jgi:hypothetical protein